MRPYEGYDEDFDDIEEFAYDRSQALHRLVNDQRREERHRNRHRSFARDRRHRDSWDWEDDDDWDTYLDDSSFDVKEVLNRQYY